MAGSTFVYVSSADTREVLVFTLDDATGALTPLQQIALPGPGQVMPMAVSPDRRFLYAAQRSDPFSVAAMAIDGSTGRLSFLGQAPLMHSSPYIVVDRTGRWLLAASYQGDILSVSPIGPQGFPQPPHQVIRTESHPHSIQVDAANRHALVPCLGGDLVLQFDFDAVTGHLAANQPPAVRVSSGAGPRPFAFHPNNRNVYLLNELEASLYVYNYDAAAGTLSERQTALALPPGFSGPPHGMEGASTNGGPKAADIHVSPDGRFLYASERTTSTLAAFSIDLASGLLQSVGSYPTEETPRGFNIDPTGRHLIAAGQASHQVSVYAIDQSTGALTNRTRYPAGKNPNWVEIIRLP